MILVQTSPKIQIKPAGFSEELVITGCIFETICSCGRLLVHDSEEILIDRTIGGGHWICITFSCGACPSEEWEEEAYIEIGISAKLKAQP